MLRDLGITRTRNKLDALVECGNVGRMRFLYSIVDFYVLVLLFMFPLSFMKEDGALIMYLSVKGMEV